MLRCSDVVIETIQKARRTALLPVPLGIQLPPGLTPRILGGTLLAIAALTALFVLVGRAKPTPNDETLPIVLETEPRPVELTQPPATPPNNESPRSIAQILDPPAVQACRAIDDGVACGKVHKDSAGVCLFRPEKGPVYYRHPVVSRHAEPYAVTETHPMCMQPRVARRYKQITVVFRSWDDGVDAARLEGADALCMQRLAEEFHRFLAHGDVEACPWPMQ